MSKAHIWAVSGALVFGIAVGAHSGSVPETRFIHGPTVYKTHTVTEEVTVPKPLPESCTESVRLVGEVLKHFGPVDKQSESVGNIGLALQELGRAIGEGDVQATNNAIEVVTTEKDKMDLSFNASLESQQQLNSVYDQCLKDMQDS